MILKLCILGIAWVKMIIWTGVLVIMYQEIYNKNHHVTPKVVNLVWFFFSLSLLLLGACTFNFIKHRP